MADSFDPKQLASLKMTIADLIKTTIDMNAGIVRLNLTDDKDAPFVSVFVIHGKEECKDVECAIAEIEARWELRKIAGGDRHG